MEEEQRHQLEEWRQCRQWSSEVEKKNRGRKDFIFPNQKELSWKMEIVFSWKQ